MTYYRVKKDIFSQPVVQKRFFGIWISVFSSRSFEDCYYYVECMILARYDYKTGLYKHE